MQKKSTFNLENILSSRSKYKEPERADGQITQQDWIEWKEDIRNRLGETAENFIVVGFRLKQIDESRIYEREYANMAEFVKKEYGMDYSTARKLMKINTKFSEGGNSMKIKEEYRGYGPSKLQEMLYLKDEELENVSPDMTVKEIRKIRSGKEPQSAENTAPGKALATSPEAGEDTGTQAGGDGQENAGEGEKFQEVPEELKPEGQWGSWGKAGNGSSAAAGIGEGKKEPKAIELPPVDAEYSIRASRRLLTELKDGRRFLILRKQNQYREGNTIRLEEYANAEPTGNVMRIGITHMEDDSGGIVPGWCVLQIEILPPPEIQIPGQMSIEDMEGEWEKTDGDGRENGVHAKSQESDT